MSMLSIKNLNADYEELHILHDVSLNVKAGEIVALIGPNGAGKSTVFHLISQLAQEEEKINTMPFLR